MSRASILLAGFAVVATSTPAAAEAPRRIANASLIVQRVAAELLSEAPPSAPRIRATELALESPPMLSPETLVRAAEASAEEAPAADAQKKPAASSGSSGSSYRAWLGYLIITRDLQIPGAPTMAVRLIPTSRALAGDTSPIAIRPRVDGAGSSWTGVDIAARF